MDFFSTRKWLFPESAISTGGRYRGHGGYQKKNQIPAALANPLISFLHLSTNSAGAIGLAFTPCARTHSRTFVD